MNESENKRANGFTHAVTVNINVGGTVLAPEDIRRMADAVHAEMLRRRRYFG